MRLRDALLPALFAISLSTGCHRASAEATPPPVEPTTPAPFATPPLLAPGTADVASLVATVKPAVVNITAIHEMKIRRPEFGLPGGDDLFDLRRFFDPWSRPAPRGQGGPRGEGQEELKEQALGSGFILDKQGHVVTNAHVVNDATIVKVKLADEREFRAKVVGKDERLDVAVLKLDNPPHDLPVVSLGSSDALRVGEYVVAIGNPFGLGDTVTMGIVSAKGRTIGAGPYDDFIQTDASINPGNSGGPLFDLRGQVIGIDTAINPQGKGIGFAIPIDAVRRVLPQLIATGHVARGRIGAVIQGIDEDLARALGMDRPYGALVEAVQPGSPAERAGIRSGDVITTVDGEAVPHASDLPRMVAQHPPGATVKLAVLHDGHSREVDVTLEPMKGEPPASASSPAAPSQNGASSPTFGIALRDEDGQAVVDQVQPEGPADGKLMPGDIIEEINHQAVSGAGDASTKLHAAPSDRPVLLHVKRGDHSLYVAIGRATTG